MLSGNVRDVPRKTVNTKTSSVNSNQSGTVLISVVVKQVVMRDPRYGVKVLTYNFFFSLPQLPSHFSKTTLAATTSPTNDHGSPETSKARCRGPWARHAGDLYYET